MAWRLARVAPCRDQGAQIRKQIALSWAGARQLVSALAESSLVAAVAHVSERRGDVRVAEKHL